MSQPDMKAINQKFSKFLAAGESVVAASLVYKRSPMGINQARYLILTDAPGLFYADPKTMELKGEIEWDLSNPITVKKVSCSCNI